MLYSMIHLNLTHCISKKTLLQELLGYRTNYGMDVILTKCLKKKI